MSTVSFTGTVRGNSIELDRPSGLLEASASWLALSPARGLLILDRVSRNLPAHGPGGIEGVAVPQEHAAPLFDGPGRGNAILSSYRLTSGSRICTGNSVRG